MNVDYQKYALDQIKIYDKSILIWFRNSGKSGMISKSIIDYTSNNYNKNVIVYVKNEHDSQEMLKLLRRNFKLTSKTQSRTQSKILYLNDCTIRVAYDQSFDGEFVDFVICDDFEYLINVGFFSHLIDRYNPKVLLLTSQYVTDMITYLDRKGDYYLNIVSFSSISSDVDKRADMYTNKGAYNVSNEYGNIQELYEGLGIKKDRKLIDVWGLKIQRRKKLEEISKKNNKDI